jgi:D-sedoheptulose 7-phosphate isomerase
VFDKILSDQKLLNNIEEIAKIGTKALRGGKKIMFCGNGGSAADSQHLAAELVSKLCYDRPGLNAIALTVDTSALTAIGNDYGYDRSFSRQVEAMARKVIYLSAFLHPAEAKMFWKLLKRQRLKR